MQWFVGLRALLGQTKDYNIGICCFSAKHAALRSKSKDWLAQNQDNVSTLIVLSYINIHIVQWKVITLTHLPEAQDKQNWI